MMSVAPGRPKTLTDPLGGSERSERGGTFHHARSNSLMLVFARVCASTCLTITAQ
jgi:hypothetical protein